MNVDDPAATTDATAAVGATALRRVTGRYRVLVESIGSDGEARSAVVETLATPGQRELEQVYGRPDAEPPRALTFIGGLPGELLDVDVEWSLPRPGRRRSRHTPEPSVYVCAVVRSSPYRSEPQCPVFGKCGGCQLQHMAYTAQLQWKADRVRAELANVGIDANIVRPTIGCEPPWGYRNHMRFSVNRDGRAGLTARKSHRVLPLISCPIAHPRISEALTILSEYALARPQLLIRYSEASGQMLIQPPAPDAACSRLEAAAICLRTDDMEERLHAASFRIRPSSFFQTNSRQAERMVDLVLGHLPGGEQSTLVDAYCGVGTFAALMAPHAGQIIAIEESASAIRDARWNLHDASNVRLVQAKVEDVLPGMTERLDGLVIDPPRAGCQRPVLDALAARRIPRVVYVSCHPGTLARDLAYLCRQTGIYRLAEVQPLDMFPQTAHIESVAMLEAA